MKTSPPPIVGYAWLLVLGLTLVLSAAGTHSRSQKVEEFAFGCDCFGYLQMAQEIRESAARRELPDFSLESAHTRLLINLMQSEKVPLARWNEMVGPHAHHYFAAGGHVGVNYPPGTGLLLAIFPKGKAVHALNRTVIALFVVVGILTLVLAARNRAWAAAGSVILALQLGLEILGSIDRNYSIHAVLAPLLLSITALLLAFSLRERPGTSGLLALVAGFLFGLALLVRLPVMLLIPGVFLLFPLNHRDFRKSTFIAFGLGVLLGGILPLCIHQQRLVGAWYLPSYGTRDTEPPQFKTVITNALYYLWSGPGSRFNLELVTSLLGFIGLMILSGKEVDNRSGLGWRRLAWSALGIWGVSTCFFLTHRVTIPYYQIPAIFASVVVMSLGAFLIACQVRKPRDGEDVGAGGVVRGLALIAALLPGSLALERGLHLRPRNLHFEEVTSRDLRVPAELLDERAWIFADMLTGTLWYHAKVPAFKVMFSDPETRKLVYRFIRGRGEPLYLVEDSSSMKQISAEIKQMGAVLEPGGEVDQYPIFLVRWNDRTGDGGRGARGGK